MERMKRSRGSGNGCVRLQSWENSFRFHFCVDRLSWRFSPGPGEKWKQTGRSAQCFQRSCICILQRTFLSAFSPFLHSPKEIETITALEHNHLLNIINSWTQTPLEHNQLLNTIASWTQSSFEYNHLLNTIISSKQLLNTTVNKNKLPKYELNTSTHSHDWKWSIITSGKNEQQRAIPFPSPRELLLSLQQKKPNKCQSPQLHLWDA